jgi:hypothetical protein
MFRAVITKIANSAIEKKKHNLKRKKEFHNLNTAKSIGILFDTKEEDNYNKIKRFASRLKSHNITTQCMGWEESDTTPDYLVGSEIFVFNKKDVKWNGEPLNDKVKEFIDKKFDILLSMTESGNMVIKYITSLSNASCKIGSSAANDMDVLIQSSSGIDGFIKQLERYLGFKS